MANLLSECGIEIHRHHDYFDSEEDDDVIIQSIAKLGYLIICGDKNIESDHLIEIWRARAKVVLFSENNSGPRIWTGILALHYEKIMAKCADAGDQALIIRLGKSGISKVRSHQEIEERYRKLQGNEIQRQKRGQPIGDRTSSRAAVVKSSAVRRSGDGRTEDTAATEGREAEEEKG